MSVIEPGEPPDLPLSEAFNRKECVLIASELMADAQRHTLLPIIRTDAGGLTSVSANRKRCRRISAVTDPSGYCRQIKLRKVIEG